MQFAHLKKKLGSLRSSCSLAELGVALVSRRSPRPTVVFTGDKNPHAILSRQHSVAIIPEKYSTNNRTLMARTDTAGSSSHTSRCRKLVLDGFQDALRRRRVAVVAVLECRRASL